LDLVECPLDLIKVKLQTGNEYKGIMDVATKTLKAEGALGFYRGVSAPLVGITPIFAVCFWGYDLGLKLVRRANNRAPHEELSIAEKSVAGAFSAIPATVIMAPVERVKCLLQIQSNKLAPGQSAQYTGMADCAKKLLVTGGLRSLCKGWEATLLRDIPG
jgi:solute carrier family 25 (mitochondrial carnitine/acylcarnitine transporter), member 20/29